MLVEKSHILSQELDIPAFCYMNELIFGRLGLGDFIVKSTPEKKIVLEIPNTTGKLVMSPFLSGIQPEEFKKTSKLKLQMAETDEFISKILFEEKLPFLALNDTSYAIPSFNWNDDSASINFDLFGSAFYILTRAEEMINPERDIHGRFPAKASHAFQNNYLHRPVVDEYIEILWACMKRLWPRLERKKTAFRMILSHDVDVPFAEAFSNPLRIGRSVAGDLLKRKSPGKAIRRISNWLAVKRGSWRSDTNYTFDRIMDLSEQHGIRSAFYFKTACTNPKYDDGYSIDHPYIRALMREIYARGHEIGFHPSYETYLDSVQTKKEFLKLLRVCEEEGIQQDTWGGRQHYLRWAAPVTWRNWADAGLSYDSTLSYADHVGFRCGTCHEFPIFDLEQNKVLPLTERPLVVMEGSLLGDQYMGLDFDSAQTKIEQLKKVCGKFGGSFTLLWHNSSFYEEASWDLYLNSISYSLAL